MRKIDNLFEKIRERQQKMLPFAMYCKPGATSLRAILQKDTETHYTETYSESGFVFAPFEGKALLIPVASSDYYEVGLDPEIDAEFPEPEADFSGKSQFENLVSKALHEIAIGTFSKVVLSRTEEVTLDGVSAESIFRRILSAYPAAFRYIFFHPAGGMWIGATPEKLIEVFASRFATVALAGTQRFTGSEDVEWQAKERDEQQFVTDYIINGLRPVAENVTVSAPYTQQAGNVVHIRTDISGEIANANGVGALLKVLHPTPAVCGFPKESARRFILENEAYDRKYYSGFLGELHFGRENDRSELYVNLRCMNIGDGNANLFVGCGVTKDSDPKAEFTETVNKAATIKRIL